MAAVAPVLTARELWDMATGYCLYAKTPTESIWLEVLRRGILCRKHATVTRDRASSLDNTVSRILNGKIRDVDPDTISEAQRIEERISVLSVRSRYEPRYRMMMFDLGTGD